MATAFRSSSSVSTGDLSEVLANTLLCNFELRGLVYHIRGEFSENDLPISFRSISFSGEEDRVHTSSCAVVLFLGLVIVSVDQSSAHFVGVTNFLRQAVVRR